MTIATVAVAAIVVPTAIVMTVGDKKPGIEVPRVVGLNPAKAQEVLHQHGLTLDTTRTGCHGGIPLDFVHLVVEGQQPKAGTLVRSIDPVYVNLSLHGSWCSWNWPRADTDGSSLIPALVWLAWIASILFVGADSKRRGERAWLWLIATLFLGVIAVAIWLFARRALPIQEAFEDRSHLLERH